AADVENTRPIQNRAINIGKRKIGICTDAMNVATVFAGHVDDDGTRGWMGLAERDARACHAQAPQVLEDEAAKEIGADFAEHLHFSSQAVQAGRRIACTAARTQKESIRQPELTWSGNGRNGFGEDVGN